MNPSSLARARTVAAQQDGVITWQQALDCGLSWSAVNAALRTGRWRRLTRGAYLVDAHLYDVVPRRATLRAALLRHGKDAALWGATAAEVLGIAGVVGWPGKPWVLVPFAEAKHPDPDARLRFRVLCETEIVVVDGFRVTIPERTLADAIPQFDRATGLSLLDSAMHIGVVEPANLRVVCELAKGRRGAPRVRELAGLADSRAATPLESRVRLPCIDVGMPPDELQWPVVDANGVLLGYGDMAWIKNRPRPLIGEADGKDPHSQPEALFWDRRRGNNFTGAAVDIVRFTWADASTPAYIQTTVGQALRAGAA
jgi:hypothetical protein